MPKPRKAQVLLEETPYYYCVSRCVRRVFLCGLDALTGKSYEHRRQWVVDRIKQLTDIFAIDTCAFSVLHNHYHDIPHVDIQLAKLAALVPKPRVNLTRFHGVFVSNSGTRR
jgi:hypothetical protein